MKRTFIHLKEAWYGQACLKPSHRADGLIDEITIQIFDDNGDMIGAEITFSYFQHINLNAPRLSMFNDGFPALVHVDDLFAWLKEDNGAPLPIELLKQKLIGLGFEDETPKKKS